MDITCLNCKTTFKIADGGFIPSEPYCYRCGADRHFDRMGIPRVTTAQRQAIEETAAMYSTADAPNCTGLSHYSIHTDPDETFGTLAEGEVEVHYHYRYNDERSPATGLEVTIFDADGDLMGSQDFG